MQNTIQNKKILLVGNPNVGKSTLFNALCNRKQKTGNYAGVTVSSHSGEYIYENQAVEVVDLPGAYSIYPSSEDEAVFSKYLLEKQNEYAGVVYVIEAISLKRGLLLFQQIQDLKVPILLVINQIDQAEKRGISINVEKLSAVLGVKILTTNAKNNIGIDEVKKAIHKSEFSVSQEVAFGIPVEYQSLVKETDASESNQYKNWRKLLSGKSNINGFPPKKLQIQETIRRYQGFDQILEETTTKKTGLKEQLTEKIDRVLVHQFFGYIIFALVLLLIFQSVFFFAEYPMGWIEDAFAWLGEGVATLLPDGPLKSLIIDGIIAGLGGIVVFAPQIGILLYLLYLLEDSGYMARAVFLMDRLLRPFGLNGKSVVPLVSGTACAIPAVMSSRNIENLKERLITILVTPFTTCSARLPIYSIIIMLVIPEGSFFIFSYKALALMAMYLIGFVTALLSALILKKLIKSNEKSYLVMDLPTYKIPMFYTNFKLALVKIWDFISGAGKVIFAVSIILWVLSYFGPKQNENEWVASDVEMQDSYLTILGKTIEPVVAPMGYDWKMGVGVITSFTARESFVGTLATLYKLEDDPNTESDKSNPEDEVGGERLIDKMKNDTKTDGTPVYTLATGISILLFYAFAMQCISTIAIVHRETKSMKWTMVQLVGMTGLAYISAIAAYQLLR